MTYCVEGTPLERYIDIGLWVKREDLSCPGGPNFSKTRGVWARVKSRPESLIGVLDTYHSQGGWAVARACSELNKRCRLFYPVRKSEDFAALKPQQEAARALGAELIPLKAGRSAILYHQARKDIEGINGYMMPNALKLLESVEETANEVARTALPPVDTVLVSASSGTIASGVYRGLRLLGWEGNFVVHMGYSRPAKSVLDYIEKSSEFSTYGIRLIDEGYSYADFAIGLAPPFPCNVYYDRKAFQWWIKEGREQYGEALFWNIG